MHSVKILTVWRILVFPNKLTKLKRFWIKFYFRMIYDYTTMPMDQAVSWDPTSIVGQAIINEPWKNVPRQEKLAWLTELHSRNNYDTFVSKLMDFECFMTVIVRNDQTSAKFVVLNDFSRFIQGPILYGPYNWPDQH